MVDANAKRRIHPGTKAEDMAAGPPLVPLNELDSPFQLQEHLAALHHHYTASNTQAITRETAMQLATPPPGVDRTLWLYELCRFLIAQCNSLIVGFLFDTPPCSQATCPEMRASEWQFLCAVHDQPKSCCAIDYCCHTLDWAANVVTNPNIFPSRFVVMSEGHDKSSVLKNLVNVFRRLHRIFAHAWFQHRGVFWNVEAQTGLYVFFKTVCDLYDLLPAENYKLPPEAEGLESAPVDKDDGQPRVTAIAKPPPRDNDGTGQEDDHHSIHARRSNTARHSRGPSTGIHVTTVIEEREDEHAHVTNKLKNMHISAPPETVEEEAESEIPVRLEGVDESSTSQPEPPQPPEYRDVNTQSVPIDVQKDEPVSPAEGAEENESSGLGTEQATISKDAEKVVKEPSSGQTEGDDTAPENPGELKTTSITDFAVSDAKGKGPEKGKEPDAPSQSAEES